MEVLNSVTVHTYTYVDACFYCLLPVGRLADRQPGRQADWLAAVNSSALILNLARPSNSFPFEGLT